MSMRAAIGGNEHDALLTEVQAADLLWGSRSREDESYRVFGRGGVERLPVVFRCVAP